ncbi:MAG: AFG1 family ATPase [Gammaproteobacteria bacterium]|jgi:cell division protein ZapE|nr:AFG1 family ATPase [Gammaproteobacteria bacterium]
MDLHARYIAALASKSFYPDVAQARAIEVLQRVSDDLGTVPTGNGLLAKIRQRLSGARSAPVRGAYLWGGVGRGKTFVMDLFYENLPPGSRLRYHFHRLMYRVHGRLKTLRNEQAPLEIVADDFAAQARVVCFDEFFVSDIADAMILGGLLDALFRRGVTLVATSNIPPEDLYRGGLQRARFLPTIDLIRNHAEVIRVDAGTDYRLRVLEQADIYHAPLGRAAEAALENWFAKLAPEQGSVGQSIEINGRDIATRRRADGIAWFDYPSLCAGPRSQEDYIEIARAFQAVIVSAIPILDETREDEARRLIAMVDEFYDRRVKLILSAEAPLALLYCGHRLVREFERTRSRLQEMQSRAYLAAPHVP